MSNSVRPPAGDQRPAQAPKETPLPWAKLTAVMAVRICESSNSSLILPFIYKMVSDFDNVKDPKDVAFYSGIIFTSLTLCQAFSVIHWGRLSDRIGRRPVLLMGLVGDTITTLLFGMSKSFKWALITRSLNGLCIGNSPVAKSAVAEMADDTNRPRMMALLPFAWNFGTMLGAMIGGTFADPVNKYPSIFGDSVLFKHFPYLLPCIISAMITLVGFLVGYFRFEETLIRTPKANTAEREPLLRQEEANEPVVTQPEMTLRELLTPTVVRVLMANAFMSLAMSMASQLYPIFAATKASEGGLGFDTTKIGYTFTVSGIAVIYLQLVAYPKWARKYGALSCYRNGLRIMIPYFVFTPFLSLLARHIEGMIDAMSPNESPLLGLPSAINIGGVASLEYILLWVLLVILILVRISGDILTFTSINLITSNTAPTRESLGLMNGTQQMVMYPARILGPMISGAVWTWSLKHTLPYPFNSHFAWLLCALSLFTASYLAKSIPSSVNNFAAGNVSSSSASSETRNARGYSSTSDEE